MTDSSISIERICAPVGAGDFRALAQLLSETVEAGEAVSFVSPFSVDDAEAWWRKTIETAHPKAIFLVARDVQRIVGTVQLHPAWAPNQPHRAEVVKLMVDPRFRGTGLGRRLMEAIEAAARAAGLTLLTLDAKRGGAAERLYRRMRWTYVGTIPRFAVDPDGRTPHDAVIFYKEIGESTRRHVGT